MNLVLPPHMVRALRHPEPIAAPFQPTAFAPADNKAWFARHFLRFASADFPKHHFTLRFYRRVMNTFGFIAHYNLDGYWTEYFTTLSGKVEFLEQVLDWPRYGDPTSSFCDVENEIARRIRVVDLLGFYRSLLRSEREATERATYARLKAKFEPDVASETRGRTAPTYSPPDTTQGSTVPAEQLALAIG